MAKKKRANNCPLFLHPNGQWCKKILGKPHYFGTDKAAAIEKYRLNFERLKAGLSQQSKDSSPTLAELANVYVDRCRKQVSAGDLTQRTVDDAIKTIKRLVELQGADSRPAKWLPRDFAAIKAQLSQPVKRAAAVVKSGLVGRAVEVRSPVTVAGDIRRVRAFLNWASSDDVELIPRPKFGSDFSIGKKSLRRHRAKQGRQDLPPEQVQAIIDRASVQFKPLLYLGINAGIGARDLAGMTLEQVERCAVDPWLDLARGKTGAPRKVWLWPETQAAIADYLAVRKRPYLEAYEEIGFLTAQRRPWLEERNGLTKDSVGWTFARLRRELMHDRGSFYDLRRTFATAASDCLDQPAIDRVMGHVPAADDMASIYRQHIADERIKRVCEWVRNWLFATGETAK